MQTNIDAPWGFYTYETRFNLDLASLDGISIQGRYAADNRLIEMRLNGNIAFVGPNISGASCSSTGCEEFTSPTPFSIADLSWFADGLNVLQVTIENQGPTTGNPTSFVLSGSVSATRISEPATLPLFLIGWAGSTILIRRERHNHA
ncbi:hypothetical protein [Methylohalobius crimeensis]|uniref:hypothetical protein n=1 Tax=Methylohalobius crimeensis TaxID=244365 RepID=UPI0003B4DA16|nr:hypothetical protein [Methylohalobius crimeensis]